MAERWRGDTLRTGFATTFLRALDAAELLRFAEVERRAVSA